jgi:hypothetical protein
VFVAFFADYSVFFAVIGTRGATVAAAYLAFMLPRSMSYPFAALRARPDGVVMGAVSFAVAAIRYFCRLEHFAAVPCFDVPARVRLMAFRFPSAIVAADYVGVFGRRGEDVLAAVDLPA